MPDAPAISRRVLEAIAARAREHSVIRDRSTSSWASDIHALIAHIEALEAVVKKARQMEATTFFAIDTVGRWECLVCVAEGHEPENIPHQKDCEVHAFIEALAALGDGDG